MLQAPSVAQVQNQLDENNLFTFQEQQLDQMSSAGKVSQYRQINEDRMPTIDDAGADAYEFADNEDDTINRQQDTLQQIHPLHA